MAHDGIKFEDLYYMFDQHGEKIAKDAKNVQLEPKLDPTWLQFGVKLARSWAQVGTNFLPDDQ